MRTQEGHRPDAAQRAVLLVNASELIKRYLSDMVRQRGSTITHAACAAWKWLELVQRIRTAVPIADQSLLQKFPY